MTCMGEDLLYATGIFLRIHGSPEIPLYLPAVYIYIPSIVAEKAPRQIDIISLATL